MFLSRIKVRPGPELFQLLRHKKGTGAYAVHQLLWQLFPNMGEKKRDFLFREVRSEGFPLFYVVSAEPPCGNHALSVDCKPYSPKLKEGARLHFSLTANPVVARKCEGKKNSKRHDVWMAEKKSLKEKGLTGDEIYRRCVDAAKNWLVDRCERYGFAVGADELVVEGYMQHRLKKNGGKEIRFSSIDYEGILTVTDPDAFAHMLITGIGKSKAFGCGLMLVRRM